MRCRASGYLIGASSPGNWRGATTKSLPACKAVTRWDKTSKISLVLENLTDFEKLIKIGMDYPTG